MSDPGPNLLTLVLEELLLCEILQVESCSLALVLVRKRFRHRLGHFAVHKNVVEQNTPVQSRPRTIRQRSAKESEPTNHFCLSLPFSFTSLSAPSRTNLRWGSRKLCTQEKDWFSESALNSQKMSLPRDSFHIAWPVWPCISECFQLPSSSGLQSLRYL